MTTPYLKLSNIVSKENPSISFSSSNTLVSPNCRELAPNDPIPVELVAAVKMQ
jgi:hypothetical protein